MAQKPTAATDGGMTPDDVQANFKTLTRHLADADRDVSPFRALFTPPLRAAIVDTLIGAVEPLTVREIADRAGVDKNALYDHLGVDAYLIEAGIVQSAGKKGNAGVWTANDDHPVVQLLVMADTVLRHGQTPMLLDERFVGDPSEGGDGEAGDA